MISHVKSAQEKLIGLRLLAPDAATGEHDASTRAALVALQQHGGLPPSGDLDSATCALLEGYICGVPLNGSAENEGADFIAEFTPTSGAPPYNKTELTYQFDPLPAGWDASDIVGGINQALQAWSAVTPLRFTQRLSGADIRFRFDGMLTNPISGTPEPIPPFAAAYADWGQISFDPSRTFSSSPPSSSVLNIVTVAMHEIGHNLGLGHSTNREAVMYPAPRANSLSADDIEGMQRFYGAPSIPVPGWFGASTSGADLVIANFQQLPTPARLDMVVGHIDNRDGADTAHYRVGWDIDQNGFPRGGWSPIVPMGGPLGFHSQGMALAVGNIDGVTPSGAAKDLVLVWMDNPDGENKLRYRIGSKLDSSVMNGTWSADFSVPGPWGHETGGVAAAIYDLNENGKSDLIVAWIDNPDGGNKIYYKIGFDIDANGQVAEWSPRMEVSGWVGSDSGGLGMAITDTRGNGRPDLVFFWVDDPEGDNQGYMRVGRDLDSTGVPLGGWDDQRQVPGWWGASTMGAGAALANVRNLLRPDLIVLNLDAPGSPGDAIEDRAHYRVLSPPLPTWNIIRRAGGIMAERIAAISPPKPDSSPESKVIVAAARSAALAMAAPVTAAVWDQTDLNENAGSDILEFVNHTVVEARPDSPVAVAARLPEAVSLFWIGTNDRIRSIWSHNVGQPNTLAGGPAWLAAGFPLPDTLPVRPGSPIAAASIHSQHTGVYAVDLEDGIVTQCWNGSSTGWLPADRIDGPWPRPVIALAAERRDTRIFLYWVDDSGAIWESAVDDQNVHSGPLPIQPAGTVDAGSNLVAVSRQTDRMDLFWLDAAGLVFSTFWSPAAGWAPPFDVGSGRTAVLPSSVAAVHVGESRMQVFWEEPNQSIWSSWWAPRPDGVVVPWSRPVQVAPGGSTLGGGDMVAVARGAGHVRLFFIDNTGRLAETFWGTTP